MNDYIPTGQDARDDALKLPDDMFGPNTEVPVVKQQLKSYPDRGFVLYNVLSPAECKLLIEESERLGYDEIQGIRKESRNNLRICVNAHGLSKKLYERIKPFLEPTVKVTKESAFDIANDYLTEGRWHLKRLNDYWRFCKYDVSGHFSPHFDGNYVPNRNERSFYTFMIYLNEEFEGGETNFIEQFQELYRDPQTNTFRAKEEAILERLHPKTGMALVFLHPTMHEGAALLSNVKYIMRSEAMYQLDENSLSEVLSKEEIEARSLFIEAEKTEKEDAVAAKILFNKSFKLWPKLEELYWITRG